jgi:hypothetical protein
MRRERRGEERLTVQQAVRVQATDARPVTPVDALIEDRSDRGVRVSAPAPLLAESVIVLVPSNRRPPLTAQIVWTRKRDDMWQAGCRLLSSIADEPPREAEAAEPGSWVARAGLVLGLVGLTVAIVYAALRFATYVAEEAVLTR